MSPAEEQRAPAFGSTTVVVLATWLVVAVGACSTWVFVSGDDVVAAEASFSSAVSLISASDIGMAPEESALLHAARTDANTTYATDRKSCVERRTGET